MTYVQAFGRMILLFTFCTLVYSSIYAQSGFPDREERIYTLSTLWKEVQYNFAFPENWKETNLDSLYIAYLPKVESAKDNYEYYRILSSFMAHCNEAHTRIIADKRPDDMPALITTSVGSRILVKNVAENVSAQLPINSEILKVNDIPVIEYLKDSIYPYIGAATAHWRFDKSVTEMWYGRPLSEVKLTARTPKGKIKEIVMCRNFYTNGAKETMADTATVAPVEIKILKGNLGYIHLSTCVGEKVKEIHAVFYERLPELLKCKGLIIDVRGNRGGSDEAWEPIVFHLMSDKEFELKGQWLTRKHIAAYRMYGERSSNSSMREYYEGTAMQVVSYPPYKNETLDSLRLNQPVVVLSGQCVASAAEDFLLVMKDCKKALVVGEPSVGCVGEPMFIDLPGGYTVMLSVKKYVNEDGTQPNDTGILPDIAVARDYNAYLKGVDNQLERAKEELQKLIGKD